MLILALGPVWIVVVHLIHVREGTDFGRKLASLDRKIRLFMILAISASVAYHWMSGPLRPCPWLAIRLLIWAGVASSALIGILKPGQGPIGGRRVVPSLTTAAVGADGRTASANRHRETG